MAKIHDIYELLSFCDKVNDVIMMHDCPRFMSMQLNIGYDDDDGPFDVWLCSEYDDDVNVCIQQSFPIAGQVIIDKVMSELNKAKGGIDEMIEQIKKL